MLATACLDQKPKLVHLTMLCFNSLFPRTFPLSRCLSFLKFCSCHKLTQWHSPVWYSNLLFSSLYNIQGTSREYISLSFFFLLFLYCYCGHCQHSVHGFACTCSQCELQFSDTMSVLLLWCCCEVLSKCSYWGNEIPKYCQFKVLTIVFCHISYTLMTDLHLHEELSTIGFIDWVPMELQQLPA